MKKNVNLALTDLTSKSKVVLFHEHYVPTEQTELGKSSIIHVMLLCIYKYFFRVSRNSPWKPEHCEHDCTFATLVKGGFFHLNLRVQM